MAYFGEIRLYAGPDTSLPPGWAVCDGSTIDADSNGDLLASIGTLYGLSTFLKLPDLRSRVPVHASPGMITIGAALSGGVESVSLPDGHVPAHSHPAGCTSTAASTAAASGHLLAISSDNYSTGTATRSLASTSTSVEGTGSSTPHSNLQPYLALNWIICISGGVRPVAGTTSGGAFTAWGGMVMFTAFPEIEPNHFLRADRQPLLRSTYTGLFDLISPTIGTFTVTIASPAVFTHTSHGLTAGAPVYFTTTGTLPAGIDPNTLYYVISAGLTSNAFEVALTPGGSALVSSGSQSGTHTVIYCPFGNGDNSSTLSNLPDLRNLTVVGAGAGSGLSVYKVGQITGEASHVLTLTETPAHTHDFNAVSNDGTTYISVSAILASCAAQSGFDTTVDGTTMSASMIGSTGLPAPSHENRQPFLSVTMQIAVDEPDVDEITGEIRFSFLPTSSVPSGWVVADGSSRVRATDTALFALIGITFGAVDGTHFNLPDLRGVVAVGVGPGDMAQGLSAYTLSQTGGTESVTLSSSQMGAHSHAVFTVDGAGLRGGIGGTVTGTPSGNLLGADVTQLHTKYHSTGSGSAVVLNADAIRSAGSGGAHENRMPSIALTPMIKL